jgi:hypothetical protein
MMKPVFLLLSLSVCLLGMKSVAAEAPARSVPVIYVTDLYHPHDDPDDHFDLATLFGIAAFDIKAIVIDTGQRGVGRPGVPAIQQLMHVTGRTVPYATGLTENLKSQGDACTQQSQDTQGGVNLILKALRESDKPVTIFAVGSLRDLAAAYNREPALFREKAARIYVNAGDTNGGVEWNVGLDPHAYVRIMDSALPIYWMPCFGADGYLTFWQFRQAEVLETAPLAIQNYVVYALSKTEPSKREPVAALDDPIDATVREKIWGDTRSMWCTAGFLHAARIDDASFTFKTVAVHLDNNGTSRVTHGADGLPVLTFFRENPEAYAAAMAKALRGIFASAFTRVQAP